MRNKTIQILSGILVLQVILVGFLQTRKDKLATFDKEETLFTVKVDDADKFVVEDNEKKKLELTKQNNQWILPGKNNFPASETKFKDMIAALTHMKKGWPAGKTMISAKQFKVVDEDFERKISFYHGDKLLTTLYLGSSPGFKKVYARVDQDPLTYSLEYNTYDVPTALNDWMDKNVYSLNQEKVKNIEFPNNIHLENKGGLFTVAGLGEQELTNSVKVDPLVKVALNPEFDDIMDKAFQDQTSILQYTVTTLEDKKIVFNFSKILGAQPVAEKKDGAPEAAKSEEETYALTVSSMPDRIFKVKKLRVENLFALKREDLVKAKEEKKEEKTEKNSAEQHVGSQSLPTSTETLAKAKK